MAMTKIYRQEKKTDEQEHEFESYIEKIFRNHYFSNHWEFAIALEDELRRITGNKHNVTYMNSSVALISMLHILEVNKGERVGVGRGVAVFPWVHQCLDYLGINYFAIDNDRLYSPDQVTIMLDVEQIAGTRLSNVCSHRTIIIPTRLKDDNRNYSNCIKVYDLSSETCFGASTGAFVSVNSDDYADKLRWMRSSYGRTGKVNVRINGNGRFSEVQGAEALSAIRAGILQKNVFVELNSEVDERVAGSHLRLEYISSAYTAGLILLKNARGETFQRIKTFLATGEVLYDAGWNSELDNFILVRVPVHTTVRKGLLDVLAM